MSTEKSDEKLPPVDPGIRSEEADKDTAGDQSMSSGDRAAELPDDSDDVVQPGDNSAIQTSQDAEDVDMMEASPVPSVIELDEAADSPSMDEPLTPLTDNSGRVTPASRSDRSFSSSDKSTPIRKRKSLDMSVRQIEFDNLSSSSGSLKSFKFPQRIGINWRKGERLEAMDYLHKWFPAKIKDINADNMTVLIHFDGWNQRFDEWVDMLSDRIRPLMRHSDRKDRYKRDHKVGEQVYAKWTDCKMYPAKITGLLSNGSYEVIFYDGFKKQVQPINLRQMPVELKQKTFEINPVSEETLKKSKIKKEIIPTATVAGPGEKTSPGMTTHKGIGMSPTEKEGHLKTVSPVIKPQLSRPRSNEKVKGETKKDSSAEKCKVKIKRPKKAKIRIAGLLNKMPVVKVDGTDTGLTDTGSSQGLQDMGSAPLTVVKSEPVSTQTDYGEHKMDNLDTSQIKLEELPDTNSTEPLYQPPVSQSHISSQVPQVPAYGPPLLPPKAFVVESDHNRFKCHYEGCVKGFRKEHLLEYHIKYYHIDGEGAPPLQPSRKRRKTTSMCSNDSESTPTGKKAAVKKSRNVSAEFVLLKEIKQEVKEELPPDGSINQPIQISQETGEISTQTSPTKQVDPVQMEEMDFIVKQEIKTESKHQRSSSQDSVMTEEMSMSDAEDCLKADELVNCICDFYEENGLMIQCEVCMCWQHASCFGITERTLPKTYICFVCENPPGVRESSRYIHEQDWLKTGEMASFNYLSTPPQSEERCTAIKATHALVADIHQLNSVLHSLKMQLKILRTKDEQKLKQWRMDWDVVETFHDVMETEPQPHGEDSYDGDTILGSNSNDNDIKGDNSDIALVSDIQEVEPNELGMKTEANNANNPANGKQSEEKENEINKDVIETEVKPNCETSAMDSKAGDSEVSETTRGTVFHNGSEEETVTAAGNNEIIPEGGDEGPDTVEIRDQQQADQEPVDDPELRSEMELEDANHSDSTESVVEDPIEMCEKNLLSHILRVQAEISDRMDRIEEQVTLLEALEAAHVTRDPPSLQNSLADMPQLKRSMKTMHSDLHKVKKMSVFH